MRRLRGFTILEILVVVAVISVIASTILLNTDLGDPQKELERHATDIGKTLTLLHQEAIINDRNFALSLRPGGYSVLQFDGSNWIASEDRFLKGLARNYAYEDELIIDNQIVNVEKPDENSAEPHILVLASGEMTGFDWIIADRDSESKVRLRANMLGQISIEDESEDR